jgi:D-alanine-D-alanine ligase-like ATP-grasp enzyme
MYPMLWENMGISKQELVHKLIELALKKSEN